MNLLTKKQKWVKLNINKRDIPILEKLSTNITSVIAESILDESLGSFNGQKKYENNQELETTPDYYDAALEIFHKYGANNLYGAFGYALYNTYYHERQAFISQTHLYIQERLKNSDTPSTEYLKSIVRDSASYQGYANNIEKLTALNNSIAFKQNLLKILEEYGIHFDMTTLNKKINEMIEISKNTIYKIFKNAFLEIN